MNYIISLLCFRKLGYVNVYKRMGGGQQISSLPYNSKKLALEAKSGNPDTYIKTIPIFTSRSIGFTE